MTILPFVGHVVRPERALEVTSPAYDALSVPERQRFRAENPLSYLHVTRSAADEPDAATVDNATLVARGKASLDRLIAADVFASVAAPALYVYGLHVDGHSQLGLVGEYAAEVFAELAIPHEEVSDERVKLLADHFTTVGAASSPVAAAVRDDGGLQLDLEQAARSTPVLDFHAADGLHQQVWRVDDAELAKRLHERMRDKSIYIVDGHHRAGANRHLLESGRPQNLLVCVFPADALRTRGFNRLVKTGQAFSDAAFARHIARRFVVTEVGDNATDLVAEQARVFTRFAGSWHIIELDERPVSGGPGIRLGSLDPSVVDREILRGLGDRVHIDFSPDRGDLAALAAAADADGFIPLVLAPVEIDDLLDVADGGLTMPEKSTYFAPKVRSGLFLRMH